MGSVQRGRRHAGVHADIPALRAALPRTDHPRIIAELDGRFMGAHCRASPAQPLAFPQAKQELAAINGELNRSTLGAKNPVRDRAMA